MYFRIMASLTEGAQPNATDTASVSPQGALLRLAARMFPLNAAPLCIVLIKTLLKVLGNIVEQPEEQKFRKLKLANKTIRAKIVDLQGGVEFLRSMGFRRMLVDGEPVLSLGDSYLDLSWLKVGIKLLNDHRARLEITESPNHYSNQALAECALVIVLPGGDTIRGAFGLDETLENVYRFVDVCRGDGLANLKGNSESEDSPPFVLSIPYPQQDLVFQSDKDKSLKQLGFASREKLVIKKSARKDAPGAFEDNPERKKEREDEERALIQEKHEKETAAKMAKEAERKARKKERMQALSSFNEDRENSSRRASYQVSKMTGVRSSVGRQ